MRNRARGYIAKVRWQRAKTYDEIAPHEYTVRKWYPDLNDEFNWFVMFIRETGITEKFWKRPYQYLYLDDYRYWTMGAPLGMTILINRCPAKAPRQEERPSQGPAKELTVDELLKVQADNTP